MRKIGMALLALVWAGPAWAGCTLEFGADNPAPRVKLCVNGECQKTELVQQCATSDTGYYQWKNGFAVEVSADNNKATATFHDAPIALKSFSCTGDNAGCP